MDVEIMRGDRRNGGKQIRGYLQRGDKQGRQIRHGRLHNRADAHAGTDVGISSCSELRSR